MGFNLSGVNPNLTRPMPELPPIADMTNEHWEEHREWQKENCGVAFRNSVWGWRPLWHFVAAVCNNVLTEKDIKNGTFNDGHKISKTKAGKIAKKLHNLIKDGDVRAYESARNRHLESLDQIDCDLCEATGRRQEPPKTGAGDHMECNKCDGTGKVDDWEKSYPFSEDNVRQFANFCANSGGFTIC